MENDEIYKINKENIIPESINVKKIKVPDVDIETRTPTGEYFTGFLLSAKTRDNAKIVNFYKNKEDLEYFLGKELSF